MKMCKALLATLILIICGHSKAASIPCDGVIDRLMVTRSGTVEIYSIEIYGNTLGRSICNMNATWKTVSPDTCKTWYSTLLAQAAQNKSVLLYYLTPEMDTCENIATYDNAVVPHGVTYSKN